LPVHLARSARRKCVESHDGAWCVGGPEELRHPSSKVLEFWDGDAWLDHDHRDNLLAP
jgi:hypothetical protein